MPVFLAMLISVWATVLSWFDFRERRLPNWLTLGGAVAALCYRLFFGEPGSFLSGFVAACLAGVFLLIPFLLRGAGGGDVKMLFAAGAMVGWTGLLPMLVYMSLAGVAIGVVMLLWGSLDASRLRHCFRCCFDWRYDRKAGKAALPPRESEQVRIPFALAIAVGMLAAYAWPLMR